MSWQQPVRTLLRTFISDLDLPYKYEDSRLDEVAITAAVNVVTNVDLRTRYTVNILKKTIIPDPGDINDNDFLILVALRAASIITNSEYRTAANSAVVIKDGPSSIDMKGAAAEKKAVAEKTDKDYRDALFAYKMGIGLVGRAIVSPSTQINFEDNVTESSTEDSSRFN